MHGRCDHMNSWCRTCIGSVYSSFRCRSSLMSYRWSLVAAFKSRSNAKSASIDNDRTTERHQHAANRQTIDRKIEGATIGRCGAALLLVLIIAAVKRLFRSKVEAAESQFQTIRSSDNSS